MFVYSSERSSGLERFCFSPPRLAPSARMLERPGGRLARPRRRFVIAVGTLIASRAMFPPRLAPSPNVSGPPAGPRAKESASRRVRVPRHNRAGTANISNNIRVDFLRGE
jgi:hypothetical protein